MRVSLNGRSHQFYPASASESNGRVRLDGHYKSPKTKAYVKASRFVSRAKASKLGFADRAAKSAANLVL